MPLEIIRNDITKVKVDAIVNPANESLLGGGGVDGLIHASAGKMLLEECKTLGGCKTGEAKITKGYNLPAKFVIHTVGPVWKGGGCGEQELLVSCYKNSLMLAKQYKCQSVAFPLISSGIFGYPKDLALKVAIDSISNFLFDNDMLVYLVVFDKSAFKLSSKLFADIQEYIDDNYVGEIEKADYRVRRVASVDKMPLFASCSINEETSFSDDLGEIIKTVDESFSQMLLQLIDEKGISDSQCYKKANIDRKLFSKIRSDKDYHPSKPTVLAFAVSLQLDLTQTAELLLKAGFALSHSSKFDIMVEYFIKNKKYDINEINEYLFYFNQKLLGY